MNFENCKSKNFIDTLSYIIKDEYIGISLTKTLGEKLINENIDLHKEIDSLLEIANEIKKGNELRITFPNYQILNESDDINDFFEKNSLNIKNANYLLEKISLALKKYLAKENLSEEEKNLICKSAIEKEGENSKKDEEIERLNSILFEKEKINQELNEENNNLKKILKEIKMNFSFESIENINRNLHFFDEKLYLKKHNHQINLLNALKKDINAKVNPSKNEQNKNNKENMPIFDAKNDKHFMKSWSILLERFDEEYKKIFPEIEPENE